ncbi:MAG: cytochrome c biogenesis protein CcsA, partial [Alicyclobacillus sp.]|nr:cytochrome c biogenesis protein CcsA [Alicyclobacillus sp.]
MKRSRLWYAATAVVALLGWVFLYLALLASPPERVMGQLVRIMYFHVACAWVALFAFTVACVAAAIYLWRRNLRWDALSACSIEVGLVYTTLTLASGSLWAKPVWNTWWTWDPRLTTTLILWFLYAAYLLLRGTISGAQRRARVSAVLAILAFVDVPIIHLSVTWWRSIHPAVVDDTGFHMPPAMTHALLCGFAAFLAWYG